MNKIQTRFGEIEYDPENILHFPEGLVGLPALRNFVVMPNHKEGPLFWIQSIDDPDFAFVLTDPTNFFIDYQITPDSAIRSLLNISEHDQYFVLALVTVPPSREITLNLAAPIFYAPITNKAAQIILENTQYNTKTPLPKVE